MPKKLNINRAKWEQRTDIAQAQANGLHPIEAIKTSLYSAYPELREFLVGAFTDDDMPARMESGWEPLTRETFPDSESWNEAVGGRFALQERNGALAWRNMTVCIFPRELHKEVVRKPLADRAEERYQALTRKVPAGAVRHGGEVDESTEKLRSLVGQ